MNATFLLLISNNRDIYRGVSWYVPDRETVNFFVRTGCACSLDSKILQAGTLSLSHHMRTQARSMFRTRHQNVAPPAARNRFLVWDNEPIELITPTASDPIQGLQSN